VERPHSSTRLTYADYVLFPDDGLRHEIIDGEHYVTPSPVTRHQRISRELFYLMHGYLAAHQIGEVFYAPFDVVLSDTNVLVPDLVFVSRQRATRLTEKNLQGPPDLVIEILSPGTRSRDERLKRDVYERVGVEEYWLVDPERNAVRVYRQSANGFLPAVQRTRSDTLTTSLLPGLEIPLEKIFG
jgi:Uma2 family endonuclease